MNAEENHDERVRAARQGLSMVKAGRAPMIYVAGPISVNPRDGIRNAVKAKTTLRDWGAIPFVPQLSFFVDLIAPKSYEWYMAMDFEIIRDHSSALVRLPGYSVGADGETEFAERLGIPVFDWSDPDQMRGRKSFIHRYRLATPEGGPSRD